MRRVATALLVMMLAGCGPVIDRNLTENAFENVPLAAMLQNPLLFKGDTYLLGGIIIRAQDTFDGLLLECLYIPVNKRGFLKDQALADGEFVLFIPSIVPADHDKCKPGMYLSGAAEFVGTRKSLTKETGADAFFRAHDVHLWGEHYEKAFTGPAGKATTPQNVEPMPDWENPVSP